MERVFWLREGVIGGRTGPNTDPWSAPALAAAGIGAILSVNNGDLVHNDDLQAAGIDYLCAPLSDNAPPRPGDQEICAAMLPGALEFLLAATAAGHAALVHCRSGKDRTGLMLSYFLCQTERLSVQAAMNEVRRVRPIAFSAAGWEPFCREVLESMCRV